MSFRCYTPIFVDLSSSICELRLHRVNFAVFADSLSGRIQAEDAQRAYRDMWTRAYGTGAALAFILDQLGDPDWRRRIERGEFLDELLLEVLR